MTANDIMQVFNPAQGEQALVTLFGKLGSIGNLSALREAMHAAFETALDLPIAASGPAADPEE